MLWDDVGKFISVAGTILENASQSAERKVKSNEGTKCKEPGGKVCLVEQNTRTRRKTSPTSLRQTRESNKANQT